MTLEQQDNWKTIGKGHVMVCPLTLHVFLKPSLDPQHCGPSLNLSDWRPTYLGCQPTSYSLSWTLISFLFSPFTWYSWSPPVYVLISNLWSWLQLHVPSFGLCPWLDIQLLTWLEHLSLISEDYHCVRYVPCHLFFMYGAVHLEATCHVQKFSQASKKMYRLIPSLETFI